MTDRPRVAIWLELEPSATFEALALYVDVVVSVRPGRRVRGPGGALIASFLDLGAETDAERIEQGIASARNIDGIVLPAIEPVVAGAPSAAWRRRWRLAIDVYAPADYLQAVLVRADFAIASSVEVGRQIASMATDRAPLLVVRAFSPADMADALALEPWGVSTNPRVLSQVLAGTVAASPSIAASPDPEARAAPVLLPERAPETAIVRSWSQMAAGRRSGSARESRQREPASRLPLPLLAAPAHARRLEARNGDA